MHYGSLLSKTIRILMLVGITTQVFGPSIINVPTARADGPETITISRTDSIGSTNIITASSYSGMSFDLTASAEFIGSGINIIAADGMGTACTVSTISGAIAQVQLYQSGSLVGTSDGLTEQYLTGSSMTGCVYEFPTTVMLSTGSNQFDMSFTTVTGAFATGDQSIHFIINEDSFPGLVSSSGDVATSSNFGATSAQSASFTTRSPGIESISKTYISYPQIAIRETQFTAIRFSIQANNVKDLTLSGFTLDLTGYVNSSGGIQSAFLFSGETQLATQSFSNGNSISFAGLNITIPAGTSQELWVQVSSTVDLASDAISAPYDLQFIAKDFDLYDIDGYPAYIAPIYQSLDGNLIDVKPYLEVTGNRTNVQQSTIIPASGGSGFSTTIGTFELQVTDAPALVEEITLVNLASSFMSSTVNADTISGHVNTGADGVVVELHHANSKVGEAQLLNGVVYMNLVSPVSITAGGVAVFTIKVRSNTTITSAGDTNKSIRLGVLNPGFIGFGVAQTLVTAPGNSVNTTGSWNNLVFNPIVLRATTITFADQPISDSSANNLLSVGGNNEAVIFKTIVTANSSKSANITKLVFNHSAGGVTGSNFKLKVDNTVLSTGDADCSYANPKVTCMFTGSYINGLTVAASGNRSIELVADVTASIAISDYMTTSMLEGSATDYAMTDVTTANPGATVVWSDNAAPSVTPESVNWFTDAGVEKLPSNSWTFIRDGGGPSCGNGATNYPACDDNQGTTNIMISRTDNIVANRNIATNTTGILTMSFDLNVNDTRVLDRLNVFVTNSTTGACTNDTDISTNITNVGLYLSGMMVDVATGSNGCIYDFGVYNYLHTGSNEFEIRIDTTDTAVDGTPIRFTVDSSSIGTLHNGAVEITNASINGSAVSSYSIIIQPGVENITNSFVANPQIGVVGSDIIAIRFIVQANNVRDLVVRGATTSISGYVNSNGGVQDATLYAAGITGALGIESFSQGQSISFNGLNVTIPAGTSKEFWVVAKTTIDLASSGTIAPYDLQFVVNNFDIEDDQGSSITIPTPYQSVLGNQIDMKSGTMIFANRTSTTPTSIIPSSSSGSITVGGFELISDFAPVTVEELTLINLDASFASSDITSETVSGHINTSADGTIVEVFSGSNKVGEAQLLNGIAYMTFSSPVSMSANVATAFTVKIRSNATITSAGDSNKSIRLGVLSPGELGVGTTQTLITATDPELVVEGAFTNLIFNPQILRATNIVVQDQANPTQGQTDNIFAIEGSNESTLFKTIISAHSSKSAQIKQLIFDHSTGGLVSTENYKLKIDNTILSTGDATCAFASDKIACTFNGAYINGLTIAAGGSRTIELLGDVSISLQDGDYIITKLDEGASNDYSMTTVAGTNPAASIIWSDNAAPNVTPAAANWFTDAGVETLPSSSWTFVRGAGSVCNNGANNYPSCDNFDIPNIGYTRQSNTGYLITWTPYSSNHSVSVSYRNTIDPTYITIGIVDSTAGSIDLSLTSSGTYLVKLTPVDGLGTPLGSDQILTINHVTKYSIGMQSWFDNNDDYAQQEQENTVDGMNVYLYRCEDNGSRVLVATGQTDYYGGYITYVESGSYVFTVGGIPGFSVTQNNNGSICSAVNESQNDIQQLFSLVSNLSPLPTLPQVCDYYLSQDNGFRPYDPDITYIKEVVFTNGSTMPIGEAYGTGEGNKPHGSALVNWGPVIGLVFTGGYDMYPEFYDDPTYVYTKTNLALSGVIGSIVTTGVSSEQFYPFIKSGCVNPEITVQNIQYTQNSNNLSQYWITWDSILDPANVEISIKNADTDDDYAQVALVIGYLGSTMITLGDAGTYLIKVTAVDDLSTPLGPDQIITIHHAGPPLPTGPQICEYYMSEGGGFGPVESLLIQRHLKEVVFTDGSRYPLGTSYGIGQGYPPYGIALQSWGPTVGLVFTGGIDLDPDAIDAPNYVYTKSNVLFSGVVSIAQDPDYCIDEFGTNVGDACPAVACEPGVECTNPYTMVSGAVSEQFYPFIQSGCIDDPNTLIGGQVWFENQYDSVHNTGENTVDGANMFLYECTIGDNYNTIPYNYNPTLDDILAMLSSQNNTPTYNLLAQTQTDYYGGYQFSGLESGKFYNVRFGGILGFEDARNRFSANNRSCVQAGNTNVDFTLLSKATVNGTTWFDSNQDSIQQTGENTVDGMNMYLVKCINNIPVETVSSMQTDYYGGYSFTVPTSGSYMVTAGSIPTFSNPDSIQNESCRSIHTASDSWTYSLGLVPAQARVQGQTWFDTLQDGSYSSGSENTVDGMNVFLYACNLTQASNRLIAQTQTDYYGGYLFSGVAAGWYQVRFGGISGFISQGDAPCQFVSHDANIQANQYLREPIYVSINDPEFTAALQWMYSNGLTPHQTERQFQPLATLNNQEAAQMMNMYASGVLHLRNTNNFCNFADLSAVNTQSREQINQLCQKGLTRTIYGNFNPTGVYTKADLVTALAKGLGGYQNETNVSPWYQNYCTYAQNNGITMETNCSGLNRAITKYEAALMLYRGRTIQHSTPSNQIVGKSYFDKDQNRTYSTGENTVDGIQVYLYRCDTTNTGIALAHTMTDYYGGYQFGNLLNGSYRVQFGTIDGFTTYISSSSCITLNTSDTTSTIDSYLRPSVIRTISAGSAGSASSSSSSSSSNSSNSVRSNPFNPTTNNTKTTNSDTTTNNTKTTNSDTTTNNTKTTKDTTNSQPNKKPDNNIKTISIVRTTPITNTKASDSKDQSTTPTSPKKIVTIRINDKGEIEVVQDTTTKTDETNIKTTDNDTTTKTDKNTNNKEQKSYLAKDVQIQQQVSDDSSSQQTIAPINMKPYWVITPEMLQDISILQDGYQPTWDASPIKKTITLDPKLRANTWDRDSSVENRSSSFYQKMKTTIKRIF